MYKKLKLVWQLFAIFLFLELTPLFSQEINQAPIQVIGDSSQVISLDTIEKETDETTTQWWATDKKINIKETSDQFLTSSEKLDRPGKPWHQVKVPYSLYKSENFTNQIAEYWIRKTFIIKASRVKIPLALQLGQISDRDQVYLNGILIGQTGDWDAIKPQAYDKTRIYDIPEGVIRYNQKNILLIRIKGYFTSEAGLVGGTTEIGPTSKIRQSFYNDAYREILFLILYLSVGSYFLFLFLRQRKSRENLLFAMFTYLLIAYQFNRNQIKFEFDVELFTFKRIEFLTLTWISPTFYFFIRSFLPLPSVKFTKYFDIFIYVLLISPISFSLIVLFSENVLFWDSMNKLYHLYTLLLFMIMSLSVTIYSALGIKKSRLNVPWFYLKKNTDARLMLVGLSLFVCAVIVDTVGYRMDMHLPRVAGYAFIIFVLVIALILANRFVRLHNEVEDLNKNLEAKVEKRTEELNTTLSEVQTLKEQQDGDYFLTSLLINPLGGNYSSNELVDVQMLAHQKKKFLFRDKESEIGGDINVSHDIELRGRKYTIVLNADAMGKSIQGAGGALVLGTVFKSIVSRTQLSSVLQKKFPEQWLKLSFSELQDVFVSFDGSMLISMVIGLIDQESGMFYYINAEHPFVVLYRNRKAQFMEKEFVLRKVGVDVMNEGLHIQAFPLQSGDVLYLGSDGRDDILLGDDASGNRIINEDEQKFLEHIELGEGKLDKVEKSIMGSGELTDDFTLLRVAYREDAPFPTNIQNEDADQIVTSSNSLFRSGKKDKAIKIAQEGLEKYKDNPSLLRQIIRMMMIQKKYKDVVLYIEKFSQHGLEDLEFLYYASYVYKQLKSLELSADFGERCRMRDPNHLNNLANLIDVYRLNGNKKRAQRLLAKGLGLDKDHDLLKKLAKRPELQGVTAA